MLPLIGLLLLSLFLLMLRLAYNALLERGAAWSELVARYPHQGPEPSNAKSPYFATQPWRMSFSSYVGSDDDALYIQQYGMFTDTRAIRVPWHNLRLDLDAGLFIVVQVVPERNCFTFHRWFLGKSARQKLKQSA